jgi:3'-phosphoadenosine 5'-phosphosulfate sulfotransferase (PAPS reductase)/FAD synthetase
MKYLTRETPITILSFGGGQDSSAILFRLIHDPAEFSRLVQGELIVIMADTGNEHPETYDWVEKCRKVCEGRGISFLLLKPGSGLHSKSWPSLVGHWKANSSVGSKAFRKSCTDKLKIVPIYNLVDYLLAGKLTKKKALYEYTEKFGKIRVLIGIAKGEESRLSDGSQDPIWMKRNVEKIYPLIDWKWGRKECQDYLAAKAKEIPLPSNCMFCPFISERELLWLWRKYPDAFLEWVKIEQAKLVKWASLGKKNLSVFGSRDLLKVLDDAKEKYGHLSEAELHEHKMSHGHCVKSKY